MSYTALVFFKNGVAEESVEFGNAWGGAARIWDSLFAKYIPKKHDYDNWMLAAEDKRLWELSDDERLVDCERECYYFCCDADAIGLHATSICENPWIGWDSETDEPSPYDITSGDKHWFLFDEREALQ